MAIPLCNYIHIIMYKIITQRCSIIKDDEVLRKMKTKSAEYKNERIS